MQTQSLPAYDVNPQYEVARVIDGRPYPIAQFFYSVDAAEYFVREAQTNLGYDLAPDYYVSVTHGLREDWTCYELNNVRVYRLASATV